MAKLYLTTLLLALVISHATARNIPTDEATNPSTNSVSAVKTTENVVASTVAPATNGAANDQKNFIGGVGGWGGVGGYVGVLPIIGGIGIGGAGGIGGLGGLGGLGGIGGLGKVGGIGGGGGVGGIIP